MPGLHRGELKLLRYLFQAEANALRRLDEAQAGQIVQAAAAHAAQRPFGLGQQTAALSKADGLDVDTNFGGQRTDGQVEVMAAAGIRRGACLRTHVRELPAPCSTLRSGTRRTIRQRGRGRVQTIIDVVGVGLRQDPSSLRRDACQPVLQARGRFMPAMRHACAT